MHTKVTPPLLFTNYKYSNEPQKCNAYFTKRFQQLQFYINTYVMFSSVLHYITMQLLLLLLLLLSAQTFDYDGIEYFSVQTRVLYGGSVFKCYHFFALDIRVVLLTLI